MSSNCMNELAHLVYSTLRLFGIFTIVAILAGAYYLLSKRDDSKF